MDNKIKEGSVKFWRVYKGLTQERLAELCNVTTQTIHNIESYKVPMSKAMRCLLAKIFKISEEDIFTPYEIK